jgi:hypothetical protein
MAVTTSLYTNIRIREENANIRTALFKIGNYYRGSDLKHDKFKFKYQAYVKGQKFNEI